jgi:2-polyprenyl-3-methyl-5-hydroxy-6-metoxy-1,4-benzoquinol methylase
MSPLIPSFAVRQLTPELMDEPELAVPELHRALSGVRRLNTITLSSRLIWNEILPLLRRSNSLPIRLLDIATGFGDIPIALKRKADEHGMDLEVTGLDVNPKAIALAKAEADRAGCNVSFLTADILSNEMPRDYDIICCSLFMHHLSNIDAALLLTKMAAAARKMVVISDLRRSYAGYLLAVIGTQLFGRSQIVRIDGPRSVRNAFTPEEFEDLVKTCGLERAVVHKRIPFRMVLRWERS